MDGTGPIAIGALSKDTGTNVETIRYYERVGLLPAPARSAGGYRQYATGHLKRLNFIRRARTLGFSIGEVRTLLQLSDERKRPCAEVRAVADAHLRDVRAKIADLRRMERVLKATVAKCASGRQMHCPVIEALYRDGVGRNGTAVLAARQQKPSPVLSPKLSPTPRNRAQLAAH
jgi:MerR family mercuric resistance operon transcriptional regulator